MDLAHIKAAVTRPLAELPRWQRRITVAWLVLRHCLPRVASRRSQRMAAALTYHTVFSLLPTAVLVLVTLQVFVGEADRTRLKQAIVSAVMEPIVGGLEAQEEFADDDATFVGPPAPRQQTGENSDRRQEFDDMRIAVEREITNILNKLESVSFGSIGVFGFLVFLFGTTGLLTTIQTTFDSIFGRVGERPAYKRIPLYYSILTLGPVVLIGGQWMQGAVIQWISDGGWTAWLTGPLVVLSPVLTAWLLLYVMFVALPSTPVKPWAAAIGSFISAACWVVGMELFGLYVSNTAVSSLYGALALLPLSLLWIFIIWQLLLLGMQFTVALQALAATGRLPRPLAEVVEAEELSAGWTLEYAARIAAAFDSGETITSAQLQRQTGLQNQISETILEALTDAGVVRCVDGDGSYTMGRPSSEVTVAQLVDLHRSGHDTHTLVVADEMALQARFREGGTHIFGEETLADLARGLGPKLKVVESMDRIEFGPFEPSKTE